MKYFITCLYCGGKREIPFCKKDRIFCKQEHYWLHKRGQPSKKKGKKYHSVIHSGSFQKGHSPWNKGTKDIMKPVKGFKPKESSFCKDSPNEYKNLHSKIGRLFGKPDICEKCDKSGLYGKKIHWANISGRLGKTMCQMSFLFRF